MRVWTPAKIRLRPASFAAAWKLSKERVTPGSASDDTLRCVFGAKKAESTVAAASLTALCAPGYEGSAAVGTRGFQVGLPIVAGLPSVSANWMAVTGRQSWYVYLAS